jgi:chromatin remodeling complex protein RSC6
MQEIHVTPYALTLSGDLCDFLGICRGTKMFRYELVCQLCKYVRDHGLQDVVHPNVIHPDDKLRGLLAPQRLHGQLTYYNLYNLIRHHCSFVDSQLG